MVPYRSFSCLFYLTHIAIRSSKDYRWKPQSVSFTEV